LNASVIDRPRFGLLALLLAGLALLLAAAGLLPTRRLGGETAVPAMAAGLVAAWAAVVAGSLPLLAGRRLRLSAINQVLFATALRFLFVLALGVALALSRAFALAPLLLWLAGGYVALLAAETLFTTRLATAGEARG